jgi:hypothetical protein
MECALAQKRLSRIARHFVTNIFSFFFQFVYRKKQNIALGVDAEFVEIVSRFPLRSSPYLDANDQVAPTYRDTLLFAVASSKEQEGQQIMKQFGLTEQGLPALMVCSSELLTEQLMIITY